MSATPFTLRRDVGANTGNPNSPSSRNDTTGVSPSKNPPIASTQDVRKWIHSFKELPEASRKARLICFHWAGSNAIVWRQLSLHLERFGIEVKALMLPGRLSRAREPLVRSVHAIVDNTIQSMQQHGLLDGCVRTILYGHSYGALIAYEVTRAIEARCGDRIVSHLVVSSLECPHGVEMRYKDISVRKHLFSDAALMKSLTRLGGMEGVDLEILRASLPVIRADFTGLETYSVRDLSSSSSGCSSNATCPAQLIRRDSSFISDEQRKDATSLANLQRAASTDANFMASPQECADGRFVRSEHRIKCPMTVMGGGQDAMVPLDELVGWLYYSEHGPVHGTAAAPTNSVGSADGAQRVVSQAQSAGSAVDAFSHASVKATIRPYTRQAGLSRDDPMSRNVRLFIDPVGTHFFHLDKTGGEDWVREILIQTCIA